MLHRIDRGQFQPESWQLWYALEDIWVQRAMLDAIRQVNEKIATFAKVELKGADGRPLDEKLHRKVRISLEPGLRMPT